MKEVLPPALAPATLREILGRSAVRLLDVRTPGEFEATHIQGSHNVPLDALSKHASDIERHVDGPLVLICQSGSRARRAEEVLRKAGVRQLHILDGGVNAWIAAGLEVRRGTPRLSIERQVRILAGALAASGGLLALAASPAWGLLPAVVGLGLMHAGATNSCVMGLTLSWLPYNRRGGGNVRETIRTLRGGGGALGRGR